MIELTPLQVVGIFVGIPIALFALIALLVVAPSWARDARYRPDLPWKSEPVWFEGPAGDGARGAAEDSARPGDVGADRPPDGRRDGGGASAAW